MRHTLGFGPTRIASVAPGRETVREIEAGTGVVRSLK